MCLLFETIRIVDGCVQNISYHQKRMNRSVGNSHVSLERYLYNIELPKDGCYKLRVVYHENGVIEHSISIYEPREVKTMRLVMCDNIDYSCKRNDRSELNHLFEQRGKYDDIIIVRNGLITDSTIANIVLFDGERWVTPDTPLLEGTCRARLIDEGIVDLRKIVAQSIFGYEKVSLINAMIGFDENRIVEVISK